MASLALAFDILARDRASKTFKDVGDAADRAGRKGEGFGKKLGKGALLAGGALLGLGAAAIKGFGPLVKEAQESAKIGRLTEAVLKSTGGAAKVSSKQVADLAEAISNKTAVDDEAIQSGANLLLTFTKVRNEAGKGNDIFNQSVEAANNMSVALGTDMKSASIQLGKALNDPIKGVTALGRAGVSFTQQQKEQIKTLVESGDTLGAQKIILAEMQKQFGGAAEAAADPMQRLEVIAGNLGEKVGGVLLPYVEKFANFVADKVVPAIAGFIDGFENGVGAGGEFRRVLETVVGVVKNVAKWISENATLVGTLVAVLGTAVAIFKTITTVVKVYTAVQTALNFVLTANPIGIVVVAIAALVAGLILAYKNSETFRKVVDTAFKAVGAIVRWLWNTIYAPFFRFILRGFAWIVEGIGSMLDALGNIPGFGWAKTAADKMKGAGKAARGLAEGIKDIPEHKTVTISVQARATDVAVRALKLASSGSSAKAQALIGMEGRARGGPILPNVPYLTSEEGPEIIVSKKPGYVIPASQTRDILAGNGGSAGGYGRLHPHDIEALGDAIARHRPVALLDSDYLNQRLVGGM